MAERAIIDYEQKRNAQKRQKVYSLGKSPDSPGVF